MADGGNSSLSTFNLKIDRHLKVRYIWCMLPSFPLSLTIVSSSAGSDFSDNESNISNGSDFLPSSYSVCSDSDDYFSRAITPKQSGINWRGRRVMPSETAGQ